MYRPDRRASGDNGVSANGNVNAQSGTPDVGGDSMTEQIDYSVNGGSR